MQQCRAGQDECVLPLLSRQCHPPPKVRHAELRRTCALVRVRVRVRVSCCSCCCCCCCCLLLLWSFIAKFQLFVCVVYSGEKLRCEVGTKRLQSILLRRPLTPLSPEINNERAAQHNEPCHFDTPPLCHIKESRRKLPPKTPTTKGRQGAELRKEKMRTLVGVEGRDERPNDPDTDLSRRLIHSGHQVPVPDPQVHDVMLSEHPVPLPPAPAPSLPPEQPCGFAWLQVHSGTYVVLCVCVCVCVCVYVALALMGTW
jgi:hypothetical protein